MVLITVQFYEIKAFGIRCPTYIGEVTVGRITCIQINCLLRFGIVDAYSYFVARHTCHRVTYIVQFAHPCGDVH